MYRPALSQCLSTLVGTQLTAVISQCLPGRQVAAVKFNYNAQKRPSPIAVTGERWIGVPHSPPPPPPRNL